MEAVIGVAFLLAIVAFVLGRVHDRSFARRIGYEVRRQDSRVPRQEPAQDPVVLLEKLHGLREAGALTEAEFEAEKARILDR